MGTLGLGYVGLAAVGRVRRARASRSRASTSRRTRSTAVNRGESLHQGRPVGAGRGARRGGDACEPTQRLRRAGGVRRRDHLRPHAPRARRRTRTSRWCVDAARAIAARLRARPARGPREHDLPRDDRGADPAHAGGAGPHGGRGRSSWPSRPSASTRATPRFHTRNTPKIIGGVTPACTDVAQALYAPGHRDGDSRLVDRHRGDGQAAREHLPQREHRPRERGGAHVRPPRGRRLGGDRRRGDQAVRLHALLSRARAWAATAFPSTRSTCRGS